MSITIPTALRLPRSVPSCLRNRVLHTNTLDDVIDVQREVAEQMMLRTGEVVSHACDIVFRPPDSCELRVGEDGHWLRASFEPGKTTVEFEPSRADDLVAVLEGMLPRATLRPVIVAWLLLEVLQATGRELRSTIIHFLQHPDIEAREFALQWVEKIGDR